MKYLPILQELFESDTLIFFTLGIVASIIIGIQIKCKKKITINIGVSLSIYIICEVLSNIHTNYMLEFGMVFIGTLALGMIIGYIISLITLFALKKDK